jgi:hypothetical protein
MDDLIGFTKVFKKLAAHPLEKAPKHRLDELAKSYFDQLKPYSTAAVIQAADNILKSSNRFPTVAEWIRAIGVDRAPESEPLRRLSADEARDYRNVSARRVPCSCTDCVSAGVSHLPIEFVPIEVDGREQRAIDPFTGKIVPILREIHGGELRRWHDVRKSFAKTRLPRAVNDQRREALEVATERYALRDGAAEAAKAATELFKKLDADARRYAEDEANFFKRANAALLQREEEKTTPEKETASQNDVEAPRKLIQFKRRINHELQKASSE